MQSHNRSNDNGMEGHLRVRGAGGRMARTAEMTVPLHLEMTGTLLLSHGSGYELKLDE